MPVRGRCERRVHRPTVPPSRRAVPASVAQLTPFDYRNPAQLPAGGVSVVGAPPTGVQLAAELVRSRFHR